MRVGSTTKYGDACVQLLLVVAGVGGECTALSSIYWVFDTKIVPRYEKKKSGFFEAESTSNH